MTAPVLIAFTAALVLVAGPSLARAGWVLRAPGLAIFVWQMVCATVLVSAALVGVTSVVHWDDTHSVVCRAWRLCLDALQGAHGRPAQVVAVLGAALLALIGLRLVLAACRLADLELRQRRQLRTMMRLTGRRVPALDVTVVPAEHPAAYLVPGGHADVVVTSAAVRQLSSDELHAVMAHERAHAAGRHYWLLRTVGLLHRAFPHVPLFTVAVHQVHRLVELRADEVATRASAPLVLARALVAMAEARAGAGHPAGGHGLPTVLAADGGETAERLERLLQPPAPLPRGVTRTTAVLVALLPLLPILIAVVDRGSALG